MLGRRRVFTVEPRNRAGEDLACGCVVPGVTSTYRRIQDAADCCSPAPWDGDGPLRGPGRQVPLLKLASRDSGVEMAVEDSSLAISPGISQDSLDFEPVGSPEPPPLAAMEPPAQRGRLLASRKLEQVLERSRRLQTSSASLPRRCRPSKSDCEDVPSFEAGGQATEAETGLEVRALEPEVWTSLPGQGLRYLEHLCLVLEQMVRLQQLYLQVQTQRPAWDPEEREESALAPSPLPSHAAGHEIQVPWDPQGQTQDAGVKAASSPKMEVPSVNPPRLQEALAEATHTSPSSQGHKLDLSHWDKVKVLLNRIRWRSSRLPEPPASPRGPKIESRDLSERPRTHRKTFMPSMVVKKGRGKNLSDGKPEWGKGEVSRDGGRDHIRESGSFRPVVALPERRFRRRQQQRLWWFRVSLSPGVAALARRAEGAEQRRCSGRRRGRVHLLSASPVSLATASALGAGGRRRSRAPASSRRGLAVAGSRRPGASAAEAGVEGRAAREREDGRAAGFAVGRPERCPPASWAGDASRPSRAHVVSSPTPAASIFRSLAVEYWRMFLNE
ncbi:PREDICTED: uncharacterized protein C8orf58 homolog [Elephantulus edwardii]|uniref:uncharacterized protein C8orf58 homolog n=1 Tax=Elephantulus edwardii TaxID=28737 RepID=UPI0003F0EBEE|nr:PREDICTED: uncharacterized protein C8orf58 homolog [Elephantulus edwardii]